MALDEYILEPSSLPLSNVSISALLQLERATNQWVVTVVITRAAGQPPIQARDVDAQLLDSQGGPLPVLERPSGPLVEAGDSLGMSANALFRFADTAAVPAELIVTYEGQPVRFRIVQAVTG
jgi:hypothetical protein